MISETMLQNKHIASFYTRKDTVSQRALQYGSVQPVAAASEPSFHPRSPEMTHLGVHDESNMHGGLENQLIRRRHDGICCDTLRT